MTSKPHKKHTKLAKPLGGSFHRNEVAIIGAPCGTIQQLGRDIAKSLQNIKVGYVDASHSSEGPKAVFHTQYTDRIDHHSLDFEAQEMDYHFRSLFEPCDLVLINGNHFKAERQVVLINQQKKDSLSRKLDRLTDVTLFVLDEGESEIFDFLKAHIKNHQDIPVVSIQDVRAISAHIKHQYEKRIPGIKGLVLAGGKSVRMGQDKGSIDYHGKPQREYAADLLSAFCEETFISVREPDVSFQSNYRLIPDQVHDLGPYGGILSAFRSDPNSAWLVTATDIPLLDEETLKQLVSGRNPSAMATCFHNPETNFPEPLITIWEPRAYSKLLYFLSLGYSCPRKALINSEVTELELDHHEVLANVNTPEELDAIRGKVHG